MVDQKIDFYDHYRYYCRLLGHQVPFSYCRSVNESLPCGRIFDCWNNKLSIKEFIEQHFTNDEIALIHRPDKPKLVHLYDLMMKASKKELEEKG